MKDERRRYEHFEIIRKIFQEFNLEDNQIKANKYIDEHATNEDLWNVIIGYLVSATAKDFTVIVRIVDDLKGFNSSEYGRSTLKNERILEFEGKKYKVRIGVIDLEGKMYTKLPVYLKEAEEAYQNFVLYHNEF